jgi:hypothetical protein
MPSPSSPSEVVHEFWRLMATNDFSSVCVVLAPDFTCGWPQSHELIRGGERFAQMNAEYPANGPWRFSINRIICGDGDAVSDVSITDGVQNARAISFFTIKQGLITRLVEFWPEPYPAPANRAHLTEPLID